MLKYIKKLLKNNFIIKKIKLHKKLTKLKNKKQTKKRKRNIYQIELKIKNRHINIKQLIIFIIIIFIISTIFIFNSSFFKIKTIEILRQDPRTNINIWYMAIWNLKWKNIFNINKNILIKKLKNYQNNLNYIDISKKLPTKIIIKLWSYKAIYNTNINNKNYLILVNWTLIPTNKIDDKLLKINILNKKLPSFIEYKQILDKTYLDKIQYIQNKLNKNLLTNKIIQIDYFPISREVHFIFKNKIRIIFDINQNYKWIDSQIKKLLIFKKEKKLLNENNLIYIDLRIKYKIFYCSKKEKYNCYKNLKNIYNIKK